MYALMDFTGSALYIDDTVESLEQKYCDLFGWQHDGREYIPNNSLFYITKYPDNCEKRLGDTSLDMNLSDIGEFLNKINEERKYAIDPDAYYNANNKLARFIRKYSSHKVISITRHHEFDTLELILRCTMNYSSFHSYDLHYIISRETYYLADITYNYSI